MVVVQLPSAAAGTEVHTRSVKLVSPPLALNFPDLTSAPFVVQDFGRAKFGRATV